ncbi:PREDICTED: max dimerization protein 1-like [Priapulus caudatus]|uniref:Max dimerization protein 1-like n=1 Tax=Priapulus caudatus TaxID=37621 RepID=A0ABM1DZG1_PRICU|nr:PREDICTED: max dimerization protein 1-like [Priapulus caudatus]
MSIAALLQAAEYIERREREAEHGYAAMPLPEDHMDLVKRHRPYLKVLKSSYNSSARHSAKNHTTLGPARSSHNELEKSRRAHLRTCLDELKQIVPLGSDSSRHTTLGLLTKAQMLIKNLEDKSWKCEQAKVQLSREQRHLKRRLEQLMKQKGVSEAAMRERSISECSSSTTSTAGASSSSSPSSISLPDMEVDILSYSDHLSDADDDSSIHSSNSDGGITVQTKRATLPNSLS